MQYSVPDDLLIKTGFKMPVEMGWNSCRGVLYLKRTVVLLLEIADNNSGES